MNNLNNKTKGSNKKVNKGNYNFKDDNLNDINIDDPDHDLNEEDNLNKNNDSNKVINLKISKLKSVTTH